MKRIFMMLLLIAGIVQNGKAQDQEWFVKTSELPSGLVHSQSQASRASITIRNRSDYHLTVKILKTGGRGLYRTIYVPAKSSELVTFSSNGTYFTRAKAVRSGLFGNETIYRRGGSFRVQNDIEGCTEGTLDFYVTTGNGVSGQGISESEFEKDY